MENKYLHGNVAPLLNPNQERERRLIEEEKRNRRNDEKLRIKRENRKKIKTIMVITSIALLYGLTISLNTTIYASQKVQNEISKQTQALRLDNEGMKANLIKASAIGNIVEKTKEMDLIQLTSDDYLVVDNSINHFGEPEIMVEKTFFEKLKDKLNF